MSSLKPMLTMSGLVGADPVLRFTQKGDAWVTFRIAYTSRVLDGTEWKDGETTWVSVTAWKTLAENVAESITKGTRVLVTGRFAQREYEQDGQKRTAYDLIADEIGLSLNHASASVERNSARSKAAAQPAFQGAPAAADTGSNGGPESMY